MQDKKQIARHLYLVEGKTQKQIALEIGVSERTIFSWVHQFAWNELKKAAYCAPATISNGLCNQLVEMQNAIAAREEGKRFPTTQEADITRKLILSFDTMKKHPSLSMTMQIMESFREFARPLNKQFSQQLAHYANRFLSAKSQNGFAPYQIEYGVNQVPEVAPFYDELDGDQPCDTNNPTPYPKPCETLLKCPDRTKCNFPDCKRPKPTEDDPEENRVADTPWAPLPAKTKVMTGTLPENPANPQNSHKTIEEQYISQPEGFRPPEETGRKPAIPDLSAEKHETETPETPLLFLGASHGTSAAHDKFKPQDLNLSGVLDAPATEPAIPQQSPETLTGSDNQKTELSAPPEETGRKPATPDLSAEKHETETQKTPLLFLGASHGASAAHDKFKPQDLNLSGVLDAPATEPAIPQQSPETLTASDNQKTEPSAQPEETGRKPATPPPARTPKLVVRQMAPLPGETAPRTRSDEDRISKRSVEIKSYPRF